MGFKLNGWLIGLLIVAFIVIIASVVVLIETGHDATGFVTLIGILLTTVAGFIGTLQALTKQAADISTVKTNTNGTLSALKKQLDDNTAKLQAAVAQLDPGTATAVLSATASEPVPSNVSNEDAAPVVDGAQTTKEL